MKVLDITEEVKESEKVLNRFDFGVDIQPVQTKAGHAIDMKAIVRKDIDTVLGVVGKDYEFIPHKKVLDEFEKSISMDLGKKEVIMCKGGAVMFARYKTKQLKNKEVKKGDIVSLGIEVFNSYDGSMAVGFQLFAERLSCLNGMTIPKSLASVTARHTSIENFNFAKKQFAEKMPLFNTTLAKWQGWTKIKPKESRVDTFLKKHTSERLYDKLKENYAGSQDKTVWGLFNILTHYNTHEINVRKDNKQNTRLAQLNFDRTVIFPFYAQNWN